VVNRATLKPAHFYRQTSYKVFLFRLLRFPIVSEATDVTTPVGIECFDRRAANSYGFKVKAPTGQRSTTLPLQFRVGDLFDKPHKSS
jgi:hypothetical protein